jgi:hypothetical protein
MASTLTPLRNSSTALFGNVNDSYWTARESSCAVPVAFHVNSVGALAEWHLKRHSDMPQSRHRNHRKNQIPHKPDKSVQKRGYEHRLSAAAIHRSDIQANQILVIIVPPLFFSYPTPVIPVSQFAVQTRESSMSNPNYHRQG